MQALYYDRDGHPVSYEQWKELGRRPGYSRVDYADGTQHGWQVTVLTFWVGIAARHGPAGRLIFNTWAGLRGPAERRAAYERVWSWPSLDAARAGHQAVAGWITEVAAFLAGKSSQLPRHRRPVPPCPRRGQAKGGEQAMEDTGPVVHVRQENPEGTGPLCRSRRPGIATSSPCRSSGNTGWRQAAARRPWARAGSASPAQAGQPARGPRPAAARSGGVQAAASPGGRRK
jgi:hypothetical protein